MMPYVSREGMEAWKDERDGLYARLDDVEEELADALEENAALKLENLRLMMDRSVSV